MPYTAAVKEPLQRRTTALDRILDSRAVMALAALLFLWFLGAHDLWAPDEPFFGEGAREMLVDGRWLVTHVNGVVNSHKPPLFFWLIAIASLPFGAVTELSARLPSAAAALGSLWLVLLLGRRWFGPRTASLSALLLMTSYMFWDKARWAQIDSLLCFLIWTALAAFVAWRSASLTGRVAGIVFWSAAALAVLAKGPVGLLLPLGVVVLLLAVERDLGALRDFAPVSGPLSFALIAGAWVAAATLWGPPEYSVLGALREHFVERGIHGMHHVQPFWYYAERLPLSLLPWSGLLPGAALLAWRERKTSPGLRFSLVTAAFVVLFFSVSTEKRDLYVLPAFPAIALMMGALVARICGWSDEIDTSRQTSSRWVTFGQGFVGLVFVLVALAVPVLRERIDYVPEWRLLFVGAVLLVTGAATLAAARRGRALASVMAMIGGMAALYLAATALIYPAMEPRKSARDFALRVKELTAESRAAGHRVLAWRAGNVPVAVAFYSDGLYTLETEDPAVLAAHLRQEETAWAVVNRGELGELPTDVRERLTVLHEQRLSRKDLQIVSNRSLPDVGGDPKSGSSPDDR
jgi:4-amino-4-deoxy-L-arabinose transferase-like glycosyltransferase